MKTKLKRIWRHDPVTMVLLSFWLAASPFAFLTGDWGTGLTACFGAICLWFAFHDGYTGGWRDGTAVQLEADRKVVRETGRP